MFTPRHPTYHVLIIGAVALLALGVAFYERQANAGAITEGDLRNYVQGATVEYNTFIAENRFLLTVLADVPSIEKKDAASCSTFLSKLLGDESRFTNIAVAGLDGQIWCSAVPLTAPISIANRAFFQEAKDNDDLAIGNFQIGRATNLPAVPFAYPVHDATGAVEGIISLGVNVNWLQQYVEDSNLPPGAKLNLVDNAGNTIVQYPDPATPGVEDPDLNFPVEEITHIEENLGEIIVRDTTGQRYYLIAAPLHRDPQEGFLHLIVRIPVNAVQNPK